MSCVFQANMTVLSSKQPVNAFTCIYGPFPSAKHYVYIWCIVLGQVAQSEICCRTILGEWLILLILSGIYLQPSAVNTVDAKIYRSTFNSSEWNTSRAYMPQHSIGWAVILYQEHGVNMIIKHKSYIDIHLGLMDSIKPSTSERRWFINTWLINGRLCATLCRCAAK